MQDSSPSLDEVIDAILNPEIVREKAILRALVDAGTKIVQMGYAGPSTA